MKCRSGVVRTVIVNHLSDPTVIVQVLLLNYVKFVGCIFWMITKLSNVMLDMVDPILFNTNGLKLNTDGSHR